MTTVDYNSEEVRAALAEIAEQHHGVLNGRDIVEAARDAQHVLHRFFEWDDPTASEAYRLVQASALIRRVRLSIVRSADGTRELSITTTRQFQSRPSMRSALGGYEPIEALLSDEEKRSELLGQVLRELNAYRRRYAQLSELEFVWVAVDDALQSHRVAGGSSATGAPDVAEPRQGAAGA